MVVTVGPHDAGFYGVLVPSLSAVVRILLFDRGLLVVTPIMVRRCGGHRRLARRGMRAEGCGDRGPAGAVMLVYNASLTISPGGGCSAAIALAHATRYLAIPFAILPLGLVLRAVPVGGCRSCSQCRFVRMVTATATQPLVGSEGTVQWLRRIRAGRFHEHPPHLRGTRPRLDLRSFRSCSSLRCGSGRGPGDAARGRHHLGLAVCNHGGRMGMGHRRRPAHHAPHGCRRDLGGGCDLRDRLHRRAHGLASIDGPARVALSCELRSRRPTRAEPECAPLPRATRRAAPAAVVLSGHDGTVGVVQEDGDDEQGRDREKDRGCGWVRTETTPRAVVRPFPPGGENEEHEAGHDPEERVATSFEPAATDCRA